MLAEARRKAGYSQERLSEALGFDRAYISRLETGAKQPSWRFLVSFANLLRVPISRLLKEAGLIAEPIDEAGLAEVVAAVPESAVIFELMRRYPNEVNPLVEWARYKLAEMEKREARDGGVDTDGL